MVTHVSLSGEHILSAISSVVYSEELLDIRYSRGEQSQEMLPSRYTLHLSFKRLLLP